MKVRIQDLKMGDSVRIADEPLDLSGGMREPIDVLSDGTVIDGCRRVKATADRNICARVWATLEEYQLWKCLETTALLREIV